MNKEQAMILLALLLISCGEKDDSASLNLEEEARADIPVECDSLSIEVCSQTESCAVIQGREITIDDQNNCYSIRAESIELGCHSADMGCTEAEEYALDPAVGECTWFSNGCLPQGWESCALDFPECS